MAYTLDSTLGDFLNDPRAKAVLEKYLPGISTNPMIAMAKGMSLNTILSFPQAAEFGLTREKAQAIVEEVNKAG